MPCGTFQGTCPRCDFLKPTSLKYHCHVHHLNPTTTLNSKYWLGDVYLFTPAFLPNLCLTLEVGFLEKCQKKSHWKGLLQTPIFLQIHPRCKRFSTRCRVAASVKSCKGSGRKSVAMTQPSKAKTAREARPQPHPIQLKWGDRWKITTGYTPEI